MKTSKLKESIINYYPDAIEKINSHFFNKPYIVVGCPEDMDEDYEENSITNEYEAIYNAIKEKINPKFNICTHNLTPTQKLTIHGPRLVSLSVQGSFLAYFLLI